MTALTSAQRKREQRKRDNKILSELGFTSLEGVMSAIRELDNNGLKNLHTVLLGRNAEETQAANKARSQTKRTRKAETGQALFRG